MHTLAVLPARYAAARLPGKPLLRETGKVLIQHVYERARLATKIERIIVATDDVRIADAVASFGGEAMMTRADHPSGTDRIAEVVRALEATGERPELVLNVQGDEPELDPGSLDRLVERMESDRENPAGTLACAFPENADPRDPNCVKVVRNSAGRALYFSRSLIPYPRDATDASRACWLLHIGVYAYRRDFLLQFAGWPAGALERVEKLEQLRILERGHSMLVEQVDCASPGVDTPADYAAFVARYRAATAG
jgi:3-deoxy-manno-octulosonate cytidylyltransferase (CMP-KDO synthetase)